MITSSVIPIPNGSGWHNTDPIVSFSATDAMSGIDKVSPDVVVRTEGAGQNVPGEATDKAGNTVSTSAAVSLDKTPPIITAALAPAANTHGWHNTDPTVSFTGTDELSGIDTVSPNVVVSTEGDNQNIAGKAMDKAGNEAITSATVHRTKHLQR